MAYALMTESGAEWDGKNYIPIELPGGNNYNNTGLEQRLNFNVDFDRALTLGKIPQTSESIAYFNKKEVSIDEKKVNIMAKAGCFFDSVLGAAQTHAGKNLTAEQILRITEKSFEMGYLKDDMSTGLKKEKEEISILAFEELGVYKALKFDKEGTAGSLVVGQTGEESWHAMEGDRYGNITFDPAPRNREYRNNNFDVRKYEIIDYYPEYWRNKRY